MKRWKARLLLLALTMVAMVLAFSVPAMAQCSMPFQLSLYDGTNSISACSNVPITIGPADDSSDDWGDDWDDEEE